LDAIGPARHLATPPPLAQAAAAGLSVHIWTVNEPDEIRRFLAAGIASVTTDVPDVAIAIRGEGAPEAFSQ